MGRTREKANAAKRQKVSWPAQLREQQSRYCDCPICGKSVPLSLVSVHMDSADCSGQEAVTADAEQRNQPGPLDQGHDPRQFDFASHDAQQRFQLSQAGSDSMVQLRDANSKFDTEIIRSIAADREAQIGQSSAEAHCAEYTEDKKENGQSVEGHMLSPAQSRFLSQQNTPVHHHPHGSKAVETLAATEDMQLATANSSANLTHATPDHGSRSSASTDGGSKQTNASSGISEPQPARQQAAVAWPIRDKPKPRKIDNSVPCFDIPLYATISEGPPGQIVLLDFVSELEEAQILRDMHADCPRAASNAWGPDGWRESRFNGLHVNQAWGVECDLRARRVRAGRRGLPAWAGWLVRRWRATVPFLAGFEPNECNAIDYRRARGHWLAPHCDDRRLSSEVLVNLSLCGDAVMTYARDPAVTGRGGARVAGPEVYRARLYRRSLQIQTGSCRYDYMHGIPAEGLLDERRVSVTFRFSPLTEGAPSPE